LEAAEMTKRKPTLADELALAADTQLLDVIKNGREVVTKNGELVRVKVSAADLAVAYKRLKELGKGKPPLKLNEPSVADKLGVAVDKWKMPQLDDTPDAATGS